MNGRFFSRDRLECELRLFAEGVAAALKPLVQKARQNFSRD
jgi:hypothetical protein